VRAPALAVTLGDPAGIGPEIIAKAWSALKDTGPAFVVVGDLQQLASAPGSDQRPLVRVGSVEQGARGFSQAIGVIDMPVRSPVIAGQPSPANAKEIIAWIETAVGLALSGEAGGVVTAPIAKAPLYDGGFKFPGHTEFLGMLTANTRHNGARGPVMMLTGGDLRVVPATVHLALSEVPRRLTIEGLVSTGVVTDQALRKDFGIARPRLVMTGLNPHAGEGGKLGHEEVRIIGPAVRALCDLGVDCRGPAAADALFHAESRKNFDAVICMYHDQALIPVKMLDFWGGVNVTLGLPIVRTSPDHGVAYDIAGRGLAREDSMIAALRLAAEIAERRRAL
jgi:4-hydroxythreonine-4-phosphate dehydrogenase